MNKGHIITTLALILIGVSVAWAQGDQTQPPAPPPVPAFGQENPAPEVTENPPISAVDQPGLEPHAAPESFLLPGLHFSESVDSNAENQLGQSSVSAVERVLGSLTLQKLWRNYDVAMDYVGGVDYLNQAGVGLEQIHQFDIDNRINWKRGQLGIRDSLQLPARRHLRLRRIRWEWGLQLRPWESGRVAAGGGRIRRANQRFLRRRMASPSARLPRLTNLALVDVAEELTPRSSVTLSAGSGIVHFYGDITSIDGTNQNITFIGSREETGQIAYDAVLNRKIRLR